MKVAHTKTDVVGRGLKHFPAARQIMNIQALFHYQERGIALTASRLFIKCMVSPDSGIFSPTFKVWALEIMGDNCCAHPNNNGAESAIAQWPIREATPSGVRVDSKILAVSVEPDVVKNRIVEFVSKLTLK